MLTKIITNTPSNIWYTQLGVPQSYRNQLIKETYRLKNRKNRDNELLFKQIFNETNSKVIGSSHRIWEESKVYNLLLKNILKFIYSTSPSWEEGYKINNAWAGVYSQNQIAVSHHHEPAYKSFCYYIKAEEPYTPMVFKNENIEIDAITDRLIVFYSTLSHEVPPCISDERIMIAGNIVSGYEKIGSFEI